MAMFMSIEQQTRRRFRERRNLLEQLNGLEFYLRFRLRKATVRVSFKILIALFLFSIFLNWCAQQLNFQATDQEQYRPKCKFWQHFFTCVHRFFKCKLEICWD
jgi:hypothetical protein